jgi:hypothetical protein
MLREVARRLLGSPLQTLPQTTDTQAVWEAGASPPNRNTSTSPPSLTTGKLTTRAAIRFFHARVQYEPMEKVQPEGFKPQAFRSARPRGTVPPPRSSSES